MSEIDLEEDYEATCLDGFRIDPYSGIPILVGKLTQMCSYSEIQDRETTQKLHKYESLPGTNPPKANYKLCMKMSTRSSAGSQCTKAEDLRPWSALRQGLHHLLMDICFRDDDWMLICDFVFDRLKAIRSDMIVQHIEGLRYIEVLEGSVRFLIYSMYRLTCTIKDYTDEIETSRPIIPNQGAVTGLNCQELTVVREMKLTMKCLRDCLNSLIIQYQENNPDSPNRPLFEAVNLIVNLPFLPLTNQSETQFQADKNLRNKYPMFKTVFKMYLEHLSGNHLTALKSLPLLIEYPLLIMSYAPAIAYLQVNLVQIFKYAYEKGVNSCPVRYLADLICPSYLESDLEEREMFARLASVQFQFYDTIKDQINFRLGSPALQKCLRTSKSKDCENETRDFALQMIFGRDWEIYKKSLNLTGLKSVLDPTQPEVEPKFELPNQISLANESVVQ